MEHLMFSKMELRTIFIFIISILNVSSNVLAEVSLCSESAPQCKCVDLHQEEIYYSCKDNGSNQTDIYWVPTSDIRITCSDDTDSNEWYNLLKGVNLTGNYKQVTIRKCPIPKKQIKFIWNEVFIGEVKTLSIDYTNELNNTYGRYHFEDLHSVERFEFRNNRVKPLPEDALTGMPNLRVVLLNRNYLQSIPVNFFKPVPKVVFLDLAENNLSRIEIDTFKFIPKLSTLNLNGNFLSNLTRDVFEPVKNLTRLDLTFNRIKTLPEDLFYDLPKLQDLNLNSNEISSLPKEILSKLKSLKRFRAIHAFSERNAAVIPGLLSNLELLAEVVIERNNLTTLPEDFFKGSSSLTNVTLKMNRLTSLPGALFQTSSDVQMIDISRNKLKALNESLFAGLRKLTNLYIEKNELEVISERTFADLSSLRELHLENNRLNVLEDDVFKNLFNLRIINLSNNQLDLKMKDRSGNSMLRNCLRLGEISAKNNSIDMIFEDWQLMLTNLATLDLSYNKLKFLELRDFQFVQSNIHSLQLILDGNEISLIDLQNYEYWVENNLCVEKPCTYDSRDLKISLKNNPFNCDCKSYDFIRLIQGRVSSSARNYVNMQSKEELRCAEPLALTNTTLINVDLKRLYCPINCPANCSCRVRAVDKISEVNCTNVEKLPTWLPNGTAVTGVELYLSRNKLENCETVSHLMNYNLTKLSLSSNELRNIDSLDFPRTLKILELDHNKISSLDKKSVEKLNSTKASVSLYGNPWKCDCSAKYLLNFIKFGISESLIAQVKNITCEDTKQSLINLSVDDLCSNSFYLYIICLSLAAFGILFGALTILYLQYEHEVKVFMFAHKICLWLVTEKEIDRDKEYDAFISYSHHDEEFVVKHLIPGLENGPYPYRLCLHYRNWIVGDLIPEQIVRSVGSSRRTIIVLSRNYMESKWANLEFRTAYLQALKERRARVIVVLLEELNPEEELDPELKAYITMNTYLKWGDSLFWEKLRYALPHPQQYSSKSGSGKRTAKIISSKNRKKLMEALNLKETIILSEKKSTGTEVFTC